MDTQMTLSRRAPKETGSEACSAIGMILHEMVTAVYSVVGHSGLLMRSSFTTLSKYVLEDFPCVLV